MKILGLGEEKNDRVDNIFVKEVSDKKEEEEEDTSRSIEVKEEDNDYIDPDDINYYEYEDMIGEIEEKGWNLISSAGLYPITHFNTDIVIKSTVKKNTYEKFLEIVCPPGYLIAICGFNQEDIDKEKFFDSPNLFSIPHFFSIKLTDDNENEILSTTIIGISKINIKGEMEKLYQEFYGDLSSTIGGKLKKKEERYYFAETIILQGGEKLIFHIYWPYTDVSKIELLMMADIFRKDIEE